MKGSGKNIGWKYIASEITVVIKNAENKFWCKMNIRM